MNDDAPTILKTPAAEAADCNAQIEQWAVQSQARSESARKAAETRRRAKVEAEDAILLNTRVAYQRGESAYYFEAADTTVVDDVAFLLAHFEGPDGFEGKDIALWHADRLVAVIRRDRNGVPEATTFDHQPVGPPAE